jgi:outer membrane biosynthesis protein TonB
MWCIQDSCGFCLTHVESIVGQDRDPQEAIRIAKRMIIDGRMPSPEQALHQLRQRHAQRTADARPNKQTKQTKTPAKKQTNKREKKPKPLGQLIVGDITARRSEPVPVRREANND